MRERIALQAVHRSDRDPSPSLREFVTDILAGRGTIEGGKMRSYFRLVAFALFLTTALAWSRQTEPKRSTPPPDPCPLATTDEARTNCWEDLATKADSNLNALYRQLQA